LFADLVLETVDEPVSKVSAKSLINWDAKFLLKSLLEAPGVSAWNGMCTLFNNLVRADGPCSSILESLLRPVKSTDLL
jgi:hypothetical protein